MAGLKRQNPHGQELRFYWAVVNQPTVNLNPKIN